MIGIEKAGTYKVGTVFLINLFRVCLTKTGRVVPGFSAVAAAHSKGQARGPRAYEQIPSGGNWQNILNHNLIQRILKQYFSVFGISC